METTKAVKSQINNDADYLSLVNPNLKYIPGYQGYIPKVKAENINGKSFNKIVKQVFNGVEDSKHYETVQTESYNKATLNINARHSEYEDIIKIKEVSIDKVEPNPKKIKPINRVFVSGYTGHKPVHMDPLRKYKQKKEEFEKAVKENKKVVIEEIDHNKLEIPVKGYQGYMPGNWETEHVGECFKELAKSVKVNTMKKQHKNK